MVERIIFHFEWLLDVINSDIENYSRLISSATVEELSAIEYCLLLYGNYKPRFLKKLYQEPQVNLQRKRKLFVKYLISNRTDVTQRIKCVLHTLLCVCINYVVEECENILPS